MKTDLLFLDANVLFSAAYRANAKLLEFWELEFAELLTSTYAINEARDNLQVFCQKQKLDELICNIKRVDAITIGMDSLVNIDLRSKDKPIINAAITAQVNYLITGDIKDFGKYYGKISGGIEVLPPSEYLERYKKRLKLFNENNEDQDILAS